MICRSSRRRSSSSARNIIRARAVPITPSAKPSAPGASATATAAAGTSATPDAPQRPALVEDDSPLDAGAPTAEVTSDAGVRVVAPEGFAGTASARHLDDVVRGFREGGYRLGFALEDLSTGRALSYGTNEIFYPASSVKAVYCTMVLEQGGESSATFAALPVIEAALQYQGDL